MGITDRISERFPEPRRRFDRGRPMTGVEIETLIAETLDDLEILTEELATASAEAAETEAKYRTEHAHEFILSARKTGDEKQAEATHACAQLLAIRLAKEARRDALSETSRIRRAQLEALRTLAASARAVEHGRG